MSDDLPPKADMTNAEISSGTQLHAQNGIKPQRAASRWLDDAAMFLMIEIFCCSI